MSLTYEAEIFRDIMSVVVTNITGSAARWSEDQIGHVANCYAYVWFVAKKEVNHITMLAGLAPGLQYEGGTLLLH